MGKESSKTNMCIGSSGPNMALVWEEWEHQLDPDTSSSIRTEAAEGERADLKGKDMNVN